jgi:outer membrane protein OmpA-like peptidoglycan-associated protein
MMVQSWICSEKNLAKTVFALIFILIVSASIPSPVFAAVKSRSKPIPVTLGGFSLTPTIGGYFFAGSEQRDATQSYGLKAGYDIIGKSIADSLGIEGTLNYFTTKSKTDASDATGYLFRLDAIYPTIIAGKWMPFLAVGAGGIVIDSVSHADKSPLLNYGAGLKYFLEDYLAVRADARHLVVYNNVNTRNNFEIGIGMSYYFGKERKKKPVPPPATKKTSGIPALEDIAKTTGGKYDEVNKPAVKDETPPGTPSPPLLLSLALSPLVALESAVMPLFQAEAPTESAKKDGTPAETPSKVFPQISESTAAEPCGYYTLSTGGSINRKKLEPLLGKLKAAGQQPVVVKETRDTDVYSLVSECGNTRESAMERQTQISRLVKDAFIIRGRKSYCVAAGSFQVKNNAMQELERLAYNGIPVKVVKSRKALPVWRINSGCYADTRQAEEEAKTVAAHGIVTTIEKYSPGMAVYEEQKVVRELTIEFDFDSYEIPPIYAAQLNEIADFLKSSPASSALIEGHSDNKGKKSYNLKLSIRRAQSVKTSLVKSGIASNRIFIKGYGPTIPVADNATTEGRRNNRRAVTIVTKIK